MAGNDWPRLTPDAFDVAISEGDGFVADAGRANTLAEQQLKIALAQASYQKATAIATSRVAGRLRLIESTALEATEGASGR